VGAVRLPQKEGKMTRQELLDMGLSFEDLKSFGFRDIQGLRTLVSSRGESFVYQPCIVRRYRYSPFYRIELRPKNGSLHTFDM